MNDFLLLYDQVTAAKLVIGGTLFFFLSVAVGVYVAEYRRKLTPKAPSPFQFIYGGGKDVKAPAVPQAPTHVKPVSPAPTGQPPAEPDDARIRAAKLRRELAETEAELFQGVDTTSKAKVTYDIILKGRRQSVTEDEYNRFNF